MLASAACCINIGITSSYLHLYFANYVILIGVVCFSFFYVPLLIIEKLKIGEPNILMSGFGIFGVSIYLLGLIFQIMYLRGAKFLLISGFIFVFFIYFPMYFNNKTISEDRKSTFLRTAFFYIIIGVLLAFYISAFMMSFTLYLN